MSEILGSGADEVVPRTFKDHHAFQAQAAARATADGHDNVQIATSTGPDGTEVLGAEGRSGAATVNVTLAAPRSA